MRGLSALQVGMSLTNVFEAHDMLPGPLVVAEFQRDSIDGVLPAGANISSHQLAYLCEGQLCMAITETWKLYGPKDGAFLAYHDKEDAISEEEERFWIEALRDVQACGNCGELKAVLRCSRCRLTSYCNRDCQKAHWKLHKKLCNSNPAVPYAPVGEPVSTVEITEITEL